MVEAPAFDGGCPMADPDGGCPMADPRGLPRQINRTAHYALSAAALAKARTVDAEHMQHALDELRP